MTKIKHHGIVDERLDDDILLLTQRADHLAAPASIRMSAGQLRAAIHRHVGCAARQRDHG